MCRSYVRITAVLCVLAASSCAGVPENDEAPQTEKDSVNSERLIATPPAAWSLVYEINSKKTRISDFIPPDESENDWKTKLSFQSYTAEDLEIDPVSLLLSVTEEDKERCDQGNNFNVFSGYENNYQTSVRLYLCSENAFTGKGEIKLIKSVRGNEHIYLIRLVRRVEPFNIASFNLGSGIAAEEIAVWSSYLKGISLCDGSPEHPCP